MNIQQYDVVKWDGEPPRYQRVVILDTVNNRVGVIDIAIGDQRIAMTVGEWRKLDDVQTALIDRVATIVPDTFSRNLHPEDRYYQKHLTKATANWEIIRPVLLDESGNLRLELFDSELRSIYIRSAVKEKGGPDEKRIRLLLTRVMQGQCRLIDVFPDHDRKGTPGKSREPGIRKRGRPNALTEDIGENGVNVTPADLEHVKLAFAMYERGTFKSLTDARLWMLQRFYRQGVEWEYGVAIPQIPPTTETISIENFRKIYQRLRDIVRAMIGQFGQHYYDTQARPQEGSFRDRLIGPGRIMYIDSTVPDVWLVSEKNRNLIIGKATLYVGIDCDSTLPCGFEVLLEPSSYVGAMVLLDAINSDKVEFGKRIGVPIAPGEWPWHYISFGAVADRAELLSKHGDLWVTGPNISQGTTPPFRPDWKPAVEGIFYLLEKAGLDDTPGSPDERKARQGDKYIYDAQLTLRELRQLVAILLLEFMYTFEVKNHPLYHELKEKNIAPVPVEIFRYRMAHYSGMLRHEEPERLRLAILPRAIAQIHKQEGIYFRQMYYTCDRAADWFVRRPGRQNTPTVEVAYDPRLVDGIYVRREDETEWTPCVLRRDYHRRYGGLSFAEVNILRKEERKTSLLGRTDRDREHIRRHAQAEALKKRALEATQAAQAQQTGDPLTKAQRRDPAHREAERREERQSDAWIKGVGPNQSPATLTDEVAQLRARAAEARRQRIAAMDTQGTTSTLQELSQVVNGDEASSNK